MKNKKKLWIAVVIVLILCTILTAIIYCNKSKGELLSIKSESQLQRICEQEDNYEMSEYLKMFAMPLYITEILDRPNYYGKRYDLEYGTKSEWTLDSATSESTNSTISSASSTKKHSTTNLQVENVDEADITKTDGDYIYSISENKVIITNVQEPQNIKIETKISTDSDYIPEDLMLYENKLVVISTKYINYSKSNTMVTVYDITTKSNPKIVKEYTLYAKYYTSRCIDGKLYVISTDELRMLNDKVIREYVEDNNNKEIALSDIKYLRDLKTKDQTIIAGLDLKTNSDVKVNSYLFDVENAYISENNIYLLNEDYSNETDKKELLKHVFGPGGIIGFIKYIADEYGTYSYDQNTNIYKYEINDKGEVEYKNRTKINGTTINQFSLDEYNDNLRVGLYTSKGSRVVVFDKKLNKIGETSYLSEGEKMYSTRFIGDKAYMVTYKNTDPLYVIDLKDPKNPQVLGKLKIPGYSTYLHPYDENHIIGIGMQTEERVYRNSSGRITSTSAIITGMKMALFDVSDVNNPIQVSQTIIGDSRATSAVLTNHKALLFSKEKGLIAIPVNNYPSDVEITATDEDDISTLVKNYTNYQEKYTSEGYFVYNINLTDGFKLKGVINHERISNYKPYYQYNSKLLRGLWIEDNLYTVSETAIKVNKLDNLEEISKLDIKGEN